MKQRFLHRLTTVVVIAALSLGFASCGGDDDDEYDQSPIVGVWVSLQNQYEQFIFKANGSCERRYVAPSVKAVTDLIIDATTLESHQYGTFTVSDSHFTIKWNKETIVRNKNGKKETETNQIDETSDGTFVVSGSTLTMTFVEKGYSYTWTGTLQ